MATALKDIQFTTPMLVGAANASNGTTYALGQNDVLGPIAYGSYILPDGIATSAWYFDGLAENANQAKVSYGVQTVGGSAATLTFTGTCTLPPYTGSAGDWIENLLQYYQNKIPVVQ